MPTPIFTTWLPLSAPAPVTEANWHQPFSEPVRQKIAPALAVALAASGLFFCPQTAGENINLDKWYSALSEPVRIKPGLRASLQQPLAMGPTSPVVSFSWMEQLSEPVRVLPSLRAGAQQALALHPAPDPFAATGWFNWLSEPVRQKSGLSAIQQQFTSLHPQPTVSFSWFSPLSVPKKLDRIGIAPAYQQTLAYVANPLSLLAPYGWYELLSEPVRLKPGLRSSLQQSFTFHPVPLPSPVSFAWFTNLSEPVRYKRALAASAQQFSVKDPVTPAFVQRTMEWFAAFSEPVRVKLGLASRLQQFYASPPRLLPTPTITGTMSALETKDTFLAGATRFNRASSAEIGVVDTGAPGTEIGVITGNTSGTIATVSISIRIS